QPRRWVSSARDGDELAMVKAARTNATSKAPGETDVIIGGGGHVGLSLALALKRAAPSLQVALVDAAIAGDEAGDGRASAVAAGGRRPVAAHRGVSARRA